MCLRGIALKFLEAAASAQKTSPKLGCYIKALEIDRNDAPAWYSLEVPGGGRVGTENFSEAGCFIKALEINPNFAKAWYHIKFLAAAASAQKTPSKPTTTLKL